MDNLILQLITRLDTSKTADDVKKIQEQLNAKGVTLTPVLDTATSKKEIQNLAKQLQSIMSSIDPKFGDIGIKEYTSAINATIAATKRAASEQDRFVNSMTKGREQSELLRSSEGKRQQLAQNNAINKALESEYLERQKISQKIDEQASKIKSLQSSGNVELNFEKAQSSISNLNKMGLATESLKSDFKQLSVLYKGIDDSSSSKLVATYSAFDSQLKKVNSSISVQKLGLSEVNQQVSQIDKINFANQIQAWRRVNSAAEKEFGGTLDELLAKLKSIDNKTDFGNLQKQFRGVKSEADALGVTGKNLTDTFGSSVRKFAEWTVSAGAFMSVIQMFKQMITNVVELDSAMTNLYKVTDETDAKYSQFLRNANKDAQELGRSVSSLIEQSANWAKLGYSIDQSANLAKISSIYANVGEVDDKTAVSDIVTAMKAFNVQASDSITIIDKLNNLGNKYAVSSADLGTGLSNSASALSLAGNDLDHTLAMITAMSEVIQDASEAGNALKILSMRLRGYDEETESYSNDVEALNGTIANLTKTASTPGGISLFTDESKETYKSTYQIMKDISSIWDELTDKNQAQLLEAVAGKQRGNAISALLTNMEQANNVLNDSINSAGSAQQEQDRWIESIDAKIQQFTASFQTLSSTVVNSDFLKGLIDSGTTFNNVLNSIIQTIGLFPAAISAIGLGAFVKNFQDLKNAGTATTVLKEFNTAVSAGNTSNLAYANILKTVDSQTKINIISQSSLTEKQKLGAMASVGVSAEEIKAAASTGTLATAQTTAKVSTIGFTTALKGLWSTMIANPLLAVGMAVTAGVAVWNAYKQSIEDMRQKTSEATSTFVESSKSIDENAEKYKTLHDELTNANTTEERQKQIKEELLNLQKDLNDKYGEEHGKINLVTDAYKDQTQAIRELNKETAQKFLNENTKGLDDAESQMTSQKDYNIFGQDVSMYSDQGKDILDVAKQLGLKTDTDESTGSFTIRLKADPTTAYKQINDFMNEVTLLQEKYGKDDSFITTMLGASSSELNKAKGIIDDFGEKYNSRLIAEIQASDNDTLSEGYTKAKSAVDEYNEAVASGDESKIEDARNGLNDVKSSIDLTSDDWKRYGGIMTTVFDQASTGLYDFRDEITSNQDGIKNLTNDLKGLSKEDLLAMADDGQADNFDKLVEAGKKYGLTAEDVITVLQKLKIVQDEVAKSGADAFAPISKQDLISNINSLSVGFESLDKIMNSMSGKNPFDYALLDDKNFKDTFSGLGDEYTNFIETISSSPNDVKATQSAFDSLVTTWIDSSGVLNNLTEDNSNLAVAMLKNMGVANAEEVVSSRLATALEHIAAQKAYTVDMSDALSNATASEIPNLIDEATQSDIAKVALAGLAIEKANVNGTALDTSGDIENIISLTGVVGSANRALKALNALKSGNLGHGVGSEADYNSLVSAAQKEVDDAIKEASEYKGKGTSTNVVYGGGTKTNKNSSDSSSKAKEETKKNIDWIDRELQLLNDKRDDLMKKASDTTIDYLGITNDEFAKAKELFSSSLSPMSDEIDELFDIAKRAGLSIGELYTLISNGNPGESKENYLAQVLELDNTILPKTEAALKSYKKVWEDAASEISSQNKAKVEFGYSDIETFSGDNADKIQAAIDAYDKYIAIQKQYSEAKKSNSDTKVETYDNRIAAINKENEQLEKSNSLIEAQIDYYKSLGRVIDASFYKDLVNNTSAEISNTKGEISNLKEKLKEVYSNYGKNSEEYSDLKKDINEAETNLYALKKSQEEYNQALEQMPIDNFSTLIGMYDDITSTIETWGTVQTATGKKLNGEYYQTLISNGSKVISQYQDQASLIKDVMDEYDEGSDRWNELYSQLQSINSEMSSMVENLAQWNEELLNMPLKSIESYTSNLQMVIDGLTSVKSEYDTVVSAVTGALKAQIETLQDEQEAAEDAIQDQIDALEDEKEAAEDAAQAHIDALQDQLDMLEEVNEKLRLQTTYEQALYDLEKATGQKTELTIRNGEQVYEQNTDDYRSALEAVADAQSELEKHDLQSQIDNAQDALNVLTDSYQDQIDTLNDSLDSLTDNYTDQIDALQTISDKWSEISDKITQAQNEATATSVLGEGWIAKVLTGSDSDIYDAFTALYESNAEQIQQYQEQADTTNSIYSLLEDYISSYKDGTLTYEQALSGINGLLYQMNTALSSTDELKNIYDYLSSTTGTDSTAESILTGIQNGLSTTADELIASLEQYNENAGLISEYTSSWQKLTDDVSEMLDVVKEVRDNLDEAVDDAESDSSDSESGDPFRPGSSGYVDSGPGVYADGIENGLVGSSSSSDAGKMIKYLTTEKLSGGEVPVIAHEGEAILNANQQAQLLKNIRSMQNYAPIIPDFSSNLNNLAVREPSASIAVNLSYGDLSFPNVRNIDNAIEEFAHLSEQAIIQNLSKYK